MNVCALSKIRTLVVCLTGAVMRDSMNPVIAAAIRQITDKKFANASHPTPRFYTT